MMITLLAMVGLIIDAGICMASQRQAQNAADAAALEASLGPEPVRVDDRRLAAYLEQQGRLVQIGTPEGPHI
jgi:Flp pilus assembly protein TadG